MGAILLEKGVAFRVWVPHAGSVAVTGSFNNFDPTRHPLVAEAHGYWYGEVESAKSGHVYKFAITNGEQPWNELVIYELHIGTFARSEEGQPGSFDDAIKRLRYLQALGINCVEVMPIAEFAGDLSWGYNPAQIFSVETAYGGPDGFKRFVKAAHALGIAVILDVVYNDFGPSDLDLWRFDGWSENDKSGIYFYNDWRPNTPWSDTRPDFGRGEVRSYIHRAAAPLRGRCLQARGLYRVARLSCQWQSPRDFRDRCR